MPEDDAGCVIVGACHFVRGMATGAVTLHPPAANHSRFRGSKLEVHQRPILLHKKEDMRRKQCRK